MLWLDLEIGIRILYLKDLTLKTWSAWELVDLVATKRAVRPLLVSRPRITNQLNTGAVWCTLYLWLFSFVFMYFCTFITNQFNSGANQLNSGRQPGK